MDPQKISRYLQLQKISALAFSLNGKYCAIATKNSLFVNVYQVTSEKDIDEWRLMQQFHEHTQTISAIDWALDDKIITASHDRSVFVWTKQANQDHWTKMLANIDIKLSIMCAKWSMSSKKFALGSACNTLAIGCFSFQTNCWIIYTKASLVSSPIITISFHPSSNLVVIGSTNFSVKIISCSFRSTKNEAINMQQVQDSNYNGPFKEVNTLFDTLFSIDNLGGWINHVSFENNGRMLLVIPHGQNMRLYQIGEAKTVVTAEEQVKWTGLPFLSGYITSSGDIIAGGFDRKVARFSRKGVYQFTGYLTNNHKSTMGRQSVGLVALHTTGIEKKGLTFGDRPAVSEHWNNINVCQLRGRPVSYDVNGIVHFWLE